MSQTLTFETCAGIFVAAYDAASRAGAEANAKLPPEQSRGFDCGFAWVTIKPARGAFVNHLKAKGIGSLAYNGGWQIWYSKCYPAVTQSIGVHEAACEAFAAVLTANGIAGVTTGSRLD